MALLALKAAIDDDASGALRSWNETMHYCRWEGVTCSRRHRDRVVSINLRSQGLVGSLSPHLGNLSFLRSIILQNNNFRGQIPEEIGRLRRLEYLEFSNNSFGGEIPRNLTQCRNLYYLNLIGNDLTGTVVPELGSLSKLEALGLSRNRLSGTIPPSIGNLTLLNRLSLVDCGLEGQIPGSLVQLQRLILLQLAGNRLIGHIPSGLFNISTIFIFAVRSNRLEGTIPPDVAFTLPNVRNLDLGENQFTGEIPSSLSNASSLTAINLSSNNFTGLMMNNCERLTNLEYFFLSGNNFLGDFSFISSLTNCTSLQVPASFSNYRNLLTFDLSHNNLNGEIPGEIISLSSVSISFSLAYNTLTGPIPPEVGLLRNLADLDLSNNMLSGFIPNTLSTCVSLQRLHLEGNSFDGEIPEGISALSGLQDLDLSRNNMLQGEVPSSGVFKNRSAISIDGNNDLCGGISELKLHTCPSSRPIKRKFKRVLIIVIPTVVVGSLFFILMGLVYVFVHKRRTLAKSRTSMESFKGQFMRLSYRDLLQASDGFSEANLIGAGRFGSVYKGILTDGETMVAVKVLNLNVKGTSKSFMAECNALRGIRQKPSQNIEHLF
ncbi:UNVERIFIED_CONTAM: putative receptor-like protein kinase [Sesamum angustifolium]|uniref:Receptor-like protein kinase n=1 Tax=Sesamum angustifolium TaxID=2727405 RepID=A0AAW2L5J1_9LAMI